MAIWLMAIWLMAIWLMAHGNLAHGPWQSGSWLMAIWLMDHGSWPSAISYQLSAMSHQLSAMSHELSAFPQNSIITCYFAYLSQLQSLFFVDHGIVTADNDTAGIHRACLQHEHVARTGVFADFETG